MTIFRGHNIPQGLNFREKQNLVIPVQLWLPGVQIDSMSETHEDIAFL